MSWMNREHRALLEQVCDTILPALPPDPRRTADDETALQFLATSASDLRLAAVIERALEDSRNRRQQLTRLLNLLESPTLNGSLTGVWKPFSRLSADERERVLAAWQRSRVPVLRSAFRTLCRLVLFLAYTQVEAPTESENTSPHGTLNRLWPALRYPGRRSRPTESASPGDTPRLVPLAAEGLRSLEADVLVIGSGAGGGVVAAELAAAGWDVLVAEKGDYFDEHSFPDGEQDGNFRLYERRGAFPTRQGDLLLIAGSNVGGGTTVNWNTSLDPPPSVLERWSADFGFPAATDGTLQASLREVRRRLRVNTDESIANGNNRLLEKGCRALGYSVDVLPRNVQNCQDCDFCTFGCSSGAKQDTRRTYLTDAWRHGARILPRAEVQRVIFDGDQVCGAELLVRDHGGGRRVLPVRCRAVVVAAGAIHTPALLLRSGVRHPQLGRNLHLHPATAVFAWYERPVLPWQGPPQSRVCNEFADLDGRGYGVRLETCPAHPGLAALGIAWSSGRDHKRIMQQLPHTGNVLVLTRDRHGGRVTLDRHGRPAVDYRLHRDDAAHLLRGTVEALRIQHAAGAERLFSPHAPSLMCARGGGPALPSGETHDDLPRYLEAVRKRGIRRHAFALYSAHQLSSCRIAARSAQGPVDPEGRVRGRRGLYVADGSLLCTSSGVNPMLTIMALAHYVAQQIRLSGMES